MERTTPDLRSDRCCECGRSKAAHGAELKCPGARTSFATMNLHDGKQCNDCVYVSRCCAMFGHIPSDERCDFYPIRFRERKQEASRG